jgi:BASS family bile acid:Na+ symporter
VFRRLGYQRALALGLLVSQRNMGLMVAATDGALPGLTWLYFALSQFPIYLSPQLLKPMVGRLRAIGGDGMAPHTPRRPRESADP